MAQVENKPNRINKTSYKTKYPYNKVMLTESGHEVHYDDTPGKERIRISHRKGSYVEWSADGKVVQLNVGNKQEYNKTGVTFTVDDNNDVKVSGHNRLLCAGGQHIEVAGDANVTVGGDSLAVVGGNMKAAVAGDMYQGVKGNGNMNIMGNLSMKVAGDTTMETTGTHTIKAAKVDINP